MRRLESTTTYQIAARPVRKYRAHTPSVGYRAQTVDRLERGFPVEVFIKISGGKIPLTGQKESMKSSRANSHMGGGKSKSKKSGSHAHSVHVKRGHKGGFIVVHHPKPGADAGLGQDEEHPIANMDDLHAHMDSAMGDQPPMEPAAPPAAAAGPAAGPAQAPPAGM